MTKIDSNHSGRNIVICCDGTGNYYGNNHTNVVKLYESLNLSPSQIAFYDPGVGTSSKALFIATQWISTVCSKAFGLDLDRNVEDAYVYLMNNYQAGDKIFLFGFSRGAHTARRLASLLYECGLLKVGNDNLFPYALRLYIRNYSNEVKAGFKRTFCQSCPVHFIGVWDTVSALSSLRPRPKLDGELSPEVAYAYHAVSIDERRLQFPVNLWKQESISPNQTVGEVWFAGVHSDIGGWYKERGLSNISLKWMIEKARNAGLLVDNEKFESIRIDPDAKAHSSWTFIWWFVPWNLYMALAYTATGVIQALIAFFDLWFELPYRPFTSLCELTVQNYPAIIAIVLLGVGLSQRRRTIPKDATIHPTVKVRQEKHSYKPPNLNLDPSKVNWGE